MKRIVFTSIIISIALINPVLVSGQDPISLVIKEGIKKVIKAVDLQIQRFQNEVIWLQNAQKVLENTMSDLKLTEISDWVQKQKTLYADYFDELWKVKNLIAYYHRIKEVVTKQLKIVDQYKRYNALFKQDKNFTREELVYMGKFYTGLIDESIQNLDQIFLIVNSFSTQMSDASRMELINKVADQLDDHYNNIKAFNNENIMLSIQRANEKGNIDRVKKLYGL